MQNIIVGKGHLTFPLLLLGIQTVLQAVLQVHQAQIRQVQAVRQVQNSIVLQAAQVQVQNNIAQVQVLHNNIVQAVQKAQVHQAQALRHHQVARQVQKKIQHLQALVRLQLQAQARVQSNIVLQAPQVQAVPPAVQAAQVQHLRQPLCNIARLVPVAIMFVWMVLLHQHRQKIHMRPMGHITAKLHISKIIQAVSTHIIFGIRTIM